MPRVVRFSPKPTLGDKLHRLAQLSPLHVRAVELLVDRMLQGLEPKKDGA